LARGRRGRRRADHLVPCCLIFCWTSWTRNSPDVATALSAMRTIAVFSCARSGRLNGYCARSDVSLKRICAYWRLGHCAIAHHADHCHRSQISQTWLAILHQVLRTTFPWFTNRLVRGPYAKGWEINKPLFLTALFCPHRT
jgi:hypothetical protein